MRRVAIAVLALLCVTDAAQFGQLCSSHPSNTIRGWDSLGGGHYGAPRGTTTHEGVDIECEDGATVYAPLDVTIDRRVIVYTDAPDKAAINNGLKLRGEGICFMLFYIQPVKTSGTVRKGEVLGTMLPMQQVYRGITSHVHVQLCDKSDPTSYF